MPTLNYTTKINVPQTVSEIQEILGEHGADAVMIRYREREPVAVSFSLTLGAGPELAYTLPVDVAAMSASLKRQHEAGKLKGISAGAAESPEQAARVAWRVVKDWLAAQLSLVEAGQAALDQVMLPYLHVGRDRTLYQAYAENGMRALEQGTKGKP